MLCGSFKFSNLIEHLLLTQDVLGQLLGSLLCSKNVTYRDLSYIFKIISLDPMKSPLMVQSDLLIAYLYFCKTAI